MNKTSLPPMSPDVSTVTMCESERGTTPLSLCDNGSAAAAAAPAVQDQRIRLLGVGKLLPGYEEAAVVATQLLLINALTRQTCHWAEVHRSYHDDSTIFDQQSVLYCAEWSSAKAQFENMMDPKFSEAIANLCQFYEGNSITVKRWKLLDCGLHSHPSRPVVGESLATRPLNAFCVVMQTAPTPCTQSLDFCTFLHECAMSSRMEPNCLQFDVLSGDEPDDLGRFAIYAVYRNREDFILHTRQEYSLLAQRGVAMCGGCVPEISAWQRVELDEK